MQVDFSDNQSFYTNNFNSKMKKKQNESKMKQEIAYADVNIEEIDDTKMSKQSNQQMGGK